MSNVYVLPDAQGRILAIEGGCSIGNIRDFSGWVLVDCGEGERYQLCQSQYLPKPVQDEWGISRYRLTNGEIVERTREEMEADRAEMGEAPSLEADLLGMTVDHEFRITLLELGV